MTDHDDALYMPSAPVCWLWWAAEPEPVRQKLRDRIAVESVGSTMAESVPTHENDRLEAISGLRHC